MISTNLQDILAESVSHNHEISKKVMLRFGDIPHLTNFSQAYFAPGQVSPAHSHSDMYEVFFVEAGSGTIMIDYEKYPLLPGSCYVVHLGEVHEIANTGLTELIISYFGICV